MTENVANGEFSPARVRVTRGILHGVFSGRMVSGTRLVEMELAQQFGVSRTPVREALGELAGVGLVGLKPNCGAIIRKFGPEQVREIYEVRAVLESEAARLACGRLSRQDIDELTDEFLDQLKTTKARGWARRVWEADCRMHELIAANCGNKRLAEEISRYGNFVQSVREAVGNRDRAQEAAIREHLEILNALKAGRAKAAAEAMREHLQIAGEAAVAAVQQTFKKNGRKSPSLTK